MHNIFTDYDKWKTLSNASPVSTDFWRRQGPSMLVQSADQLIVEKLLCKVLPAAMVQQNSKHKGLQRPWSTEWKTIMSNNTNRNDEEIENEWHSGGDVNINPLCWAEPCHFFWCRYCSPCLPFLQQVSHQICDKDRQASEISKKIKKGWQFRTLHCNHLPRNQRCRGDHPPAETEMSMPQARSLISSPSLQLVTISSTPPGSHTSNISLVCNHCSAIFLSLHPQKEFFHQERATPRSLYLSPIQQKPICE